MAVISLVAANTLPLFWLSQYNFFSLLFLYWLESGIVGFYNILKLRKITGSFSSRPVINFIKMWILALIIYIATIIMIVNAMANDIGPIAGRLILMTVPALLISHGISYFYNFIGKKEFLLTTTKQQFKAPLQRLLVLHFSIVVGGLLLLNYGLVQGALIVFVVIKTFIDLGTHLNEHSKIRGAF
ncbi:MAG: hypothetical protein UW79_C0007G0005 [Candidatus Yanofskybacteria bacterium GW2011_GWA2_44_9]|uniref:Uncharacterized protein n=1 Tax=Candidatus Yanofskybacteria bacterium GW2011_GWA2_44_9 TaxID=1619025 RepID=A0A0G1KFQ5_9BACT|nr:MAG: hypothetical protein UW79_C0007G0005 [Candidatus Yanofskybacteria bacterium GW2011_GWA2_44_9]